MAELATARDVLVDDAVIGDRAPTSPSEDELWDLLGRADVVMRALLAAPDRTSLQRCRGRAEAWLREVNQAWVRTPVRRPREPRAGDRP